MDIINSNNVTWENPAQYISGLTKLKMQKPSAFSQRLISTAQVSSPGCDEKNHQATFTTVDDSEIRRSPPGMH